MAVSRWCPFSLSLWRSGARQASPRQCRAPLSAATPLLVHDEWDGETLGPGQGCTTVYATDGQQMLGGNSEGSREPLTKVWFVPAKEGTFLPETCRRSASTIR